MYAAVIPCQMLTFFMRVPNILKQKYECTQIAFCEKRMNEWIKKQWTNKKKHNCISNILNTGERHQLKVHPARAWVHNGSTVLNNGPRVENSLESVLFLLHFSFLHVLTTQLRNALYAYDRTRRVSEHRGCQTGRFRSVWMRRIETQDARDSNLVWEAIQSAGIRRFWGHRHSSTGSLPPYRE